MTIQAVYDRSYLIYRAIDTLKQTVPVWKKEVFEGGEEWIGREGSG